jgi:hypothetical protein
MQAIPRALHTPMVRLSFPEFDSPRGTVAFDA